MWLGTSWGPSAGPACAASPTMSLWWMPAGSRISFSAVRRASSAATRGDQAAWPRHQAHGATSAAASACVACIVPSSWFANQQKNAPVAFAPDPWTCEGCDSSSHGNDLLLWMMPGFGSLDVLKSADGIRLTLSPSRPLSTLPLSIPAVCPKGFFENSTAATSCTRCPANSYCPGGDKTENPTSRGSVLQCGSSLVTRNTGARSAVDCVAPAGYAMTAPTVATPCARSEYAPAFNRLNKCLRCQGGLEEAATSALTPEQRLSKKAVCRECRAGWKG